jgi:hypothetical protein
MNAIATTLDYDYSEEEAEPMTDVQAEELALGLSTNFTDPIYVVKEDESHWFLIGNDCMDDFEAERGIDDSHILYYAEDGKLFE